MAVQYCPLGYIASLVGYIDANGTARQPYKKPHYEGLEIGRYLN